MIGTEFQGWMSQKRDRPLPTSQVTNADTSRITMRRRRTSNLSGSRPLLVLPLYPSTLRSKSALSWGRPSFQPFPSGSRRAGCLIHLVGSIAREASDSNVKRSASDALIFGYGPALMGAGAALVIVAVIAAVLVNARRGKVSPYPIPVH